MTPTNEGVTRFANPMDLRGYECTCEDILLEDVSPSMSGQGFEPGKTKIDLMYEATAKYLELKLAQRPQDKVAVVTYDSVGQERCGLLNVAQHYSTILAAMKKARKISGGGTCIHTGLRIVLDLAHRSQASRLSSPFEVITRVLAYSDGEDAFQSQALSVAAQLKELGVKICTFGIGRDPSCVDEQFLRNIATETDGVKDYRFLGSGDVIRQTFASLATGMLVVEG